MRAERGQALPLGIALLAIGCLGALVLYNTGQVATDKERVVNTADAAAYSGLLWQARALNYQAYTNRAMVANEVSIGQAVSLNSWIAYGEMVAPAIENTVGNIPYLGVIYRGMARAIAAAEPFVTGITSVMVDVVDGVNGGLARSQEAMFVSGFAATPEIVRAVVEASDPRFESDTRYTLAGLHANLGGWDAFTASYGDGFEEADSVAMRERADIIMASRDDFTAERDWKFFDSFWLYTTPFTRHKIYREGETRLHMTERDGERRWDWVAEDTIALQNRIWRPIKGTKKIEIPIAWAGAHTNSAGDGTSMFERVCRQPWARSAECNPWMENDDTERLARADLTHVGSTYKGVRAFRSLEREMRAEGGDPRLRLRIEVAMALPDTRTSADTVTGETFATDVVGPGGQLSSVSVAEVAYRYPDPGRDLPDEKRFEAANSYNPYWDVRLAPVAMEERLVALALRGTGGEDGAIPPAAPDDDVPLGSYAEGDGAPDGADRSGAAGTALAAYGGSLAGAYGLDEGSVGEWAAERAGITPGQIDDLIPDDLPSLDDVAGIVEEELENVLRDSLEAIVEGLKDAAGQLVDDAVAEIGSPVEVDGVPVPIDDLIEGAADTGLEISRELEEMREAVAEDFQEPFEQQLAEFETDIDAVRTSISDAWHELRQVYPGDRAQEQRALIEDRIERLEERMDEIREELVDALAQTLYDIMVSHAPPVAGWLDAFDADDLESITEILVDAALSGELDVTDDDDIENGLDWEDEAP